MLPRIIINACILAFLSAPLFAQEPVAAPEAEEVSDEPKVTVNKVFRKVPDDLGKNTVLIPMFDEVPESVKNYKGINQSVKEENKQVTSIVKKYLPEYKLVSLKEMEDYKAQGYKYYLDMAVMPKQYKTPVAEAMEPTYTRFKTVNEMYRNYNLQFHYYFYIRDIQTNDAYITSDFTGKGDVFQSMEACLKNVKADMK